MFVVSRVSQTTWPNDAMAGYFDKLERTRQMLDSRYDDIKTGRVEPIDGEESFAHLREKTEAKHNSRA